MGGASTEDVEHRNIKKRYVDGDGGRSRPGLSCLPAAFRRPTITLDSGREQIQSSVGSRGWSSEDPATFRVGERTEWKRNLRDAYR